MIIMRSLIKFLTFMSVIALVQMAHAENGCPEGMTPMGQKCEGGYCIPNCAPGGYSQQSQPQQPPPPPVKWADQWGAIVIGGDASKGILGKSSNMQSKAAAESAALADCKSQGGGGTCAVNMTYYNQCIALAWAKTTGSVAGRGPNLNKTKESVLTECNQKFSDCDVIYAACSMPVRIQ
jgi:hypothetical protein